MLYTNTHIPTNHVVLADDQDVCHFCMQRKCDEEHIHRIKATDELKGKYEGQRMFCLPNYRGDRLVICKDCMAEVWAELNK